MATSSDQFASVPSRAGSIEYCTKPGPVPPVLGKHESGAARGRRPGRGEPAPGLVSRGLRSLVSNDSESRWGMMLS